MSACVFIFYFVIKMNYNFLTIWTKHFACFYRIDIRIENFSKHLKLHSALLAVFHSIPFTPFYLGTRNGSRYRRSGQGQSHCPSPVGRHDAEVHGAEQTRLRHRKRLFRYHQGGQIPHGRSGRQCQMFAVHERDLREDRQDFVGLAEDKNAH